MILLKKDERGHKGPNSTALGEEIKSMKFVMQLSFRKGCGGWDGSPRSLGRLPRSRLDRDSGATREAAFSDVLQRADVVANGQEGPGEALPLPWNCWETRGLAFKNGPE